jgi:hypothetical protein
MENDNRIPAKPKGWFSRRHESRDNHVEAVEERNKHRGLSARRRKAAERKAAREQRTDKEQFVLLGSRPGLSDRESTRLQKAGA